MMNLKIPVLIVILILCISFTFYADDNNEKQFYNKLQNYLQTGQLSAAVEMLEGALQNESPYRHYFYSELIRIYGSLKNCNKVIHYLQQGHKEGLWFPINLKKKTWQSCNQKEGFYDILFRNKNMMLESQLKATSKMDVFLPDSYKDGEKYPVIITLHGRRSSNAFEKKKWITEFTKKNCIVAQFQSSQVGTPNAFCWDDIDFSFIEIYNLYSKLVAKYKIDEQKVIISGMSQGAGIAALVTFKNIFPVKGFIAVATVHPGAPDKWISAKSKSGIKGYITIGDKDYLKEGQTRFINQLKKARFPYKLVINQGEGHQYPKNFEEQLQEAIEYILD